MSEPCWQIDLGRRDYRDAWDLQRRLVELRKNGEIPDVLLFVEHPPTYTMGRSGKSEHVRESLGKLADAVFVETDRGGDVTFHGPGQVVGYPILDLKSWTPDLHLYLRALEEVIIAALGRFGISAGRETGLTGVWHPQGKLAAIGVRVSKWVTCHGFALNVATDLEYFDHIVPCGIVGRGVTSMASVLRSPVSMDAVRRELGASFGSVFSRSMEPLAEMDARVHAF